MVVIVNICPTLWFSPISGRFHVTPKIILKLFNFIIYSFSFPYALNSNMELWLVPYGLLTVMILYFCFKTALTDPGILLRRTSPLATVKADNPDEYDESGRVIAKLLFHHLNDNFVIGKQVMIDDQLITLKYCHTCELFRPPKASHCHYCDNCVEEFDHHCPWLSNCIGRRNYRSFVLFVFSVALGAIYNCIFMLALYYRKAPGFEVEFLIPGSFFFLFSLGTGLILWGLFFYHMMLIGYDLTTAEQVKKSKSKKFNWPTCRASFYRIFFHPLPEVNIPWDQYTHKKISKDQAFV